MRTDKRQGRAWQTHCAMRLALLALVHSGSAHRRQYRLRRDADPADGVDPLGRTCADGQLNSAPRFCLTRSGTSW
jgi:hypothetical protein